MNEDHAPSKFSKWKQPLIGGLWSAIPAGVLIVLLNWSFNSDPSAGLLFDAYDIIFILSVGFLLPDIPILIYSLLTGGNLMTNGIPSDLLSFLITVIFWFILGVVITNSSKSNETAIKRWLLIYMLSTIITLFFGIPLLGQ